MMGAVKPRVVAVRGRGAPDVAYLLQTGKAAGAPAGVHTGRVYAPGRGQLSKELLVASIVARGGWVPLEDEPLPPDEKEMIEAAVAALEVRDSPADTSVG